MTAKGGVYKNYTAKEYEQDHNIVKILLILEKRHANAKDAEERKNIEHLYAMISLGREE